MSRTTEAGRLGPSLSRGLYAVATLLVVISALDFAATIWPFLPSEAGWRYGAIGLLSGFLLTPLVGVVLATLVAVDQRHTVVLRVLGFSALAIGALLLVGIVAFALDAIQVRRDAATAELRRLTELSAAKAAFKILFGTVATIWLGLGLLRQPRPAARLADERGPIVVGR